MFKKSIAYILFIIARLISYLPFSWLYKLSAFIAFILRNIINYRLNVIIQNLSRSFPTLKYGEIKKIADKFYLHFTDVFIEVIKSISLPKSVMTKRFKVENPELLLNYYKEGKNIIGLTGHIANWEWMSIIPSLYSFPCFTLYKPLRSKIAEYIMTKVRLRFGMKLLPMANAARYILSHKNEQALYIFIGDQSPARVEDPDELNFLNQPTTFFTGGSKLAKATHAAVIYISIRKVARGYYSVRFIPVDTADYSTVLTQYAQLLQDDIISSPSDWLWSHKRWKH